jgi:hypothetical protein
MAKARAAITSKMADVSGLVLGASILCGGIVALLGMSFAWPHDSFAEFLLVFVLAAEGCFAWAAFHQSQLDERSKLLDSLYDRLDTPEARRARETLYILSDEELTLAHLRDRSNERKRRDVENSIASFERLAYQIQTLGLESDDAFELWGGVILQVANKAWPYVLELRERSERRALICIKWSIEDT